MNTCDHGVLLCVACPRCEAASRRRSGLIAACCLLGLAALVALAWLR